MIERSRDGKGMKWLQKIDDHVMNGLLNAFTNDRSEYCTIRTRVGDPKHLKILNIFIFLEN